MQITRIAEDGTITIQITADEARDIANDLSNADWSQLSESGKDLYRYLDFAAA